MTKKLPYHHTWLFAAVVAVVAALATLPTEAAGSPARSPSYTVKVTCKVPAKQAERQLSGNWCLNYIPDGTQTFSARVMTVKGVAAPDAIVKWSDSDTADAKFRVAQNPCVTDFDGVCSAEVIDSHPRHGEKVTVKATVSGVTAKGYLTFTK